LAALLAADIIQDVTHLALCLCLCICRYCIGLGGLAALALTLPAAAHSPGALLGATAAVGVAYSIAFGTSYQLAARFPPNCTVALTTGEFATKHHSAL
jgi:hypothetical protein